MWTSTYRRAETGSGSVRKRSPTRTSVANDPKAANLASCTSWLTSPRPRITAGMTMQRAALRSEASSASSTCSRANPVGIATIIEGGCQGASKSAPVSGIEKCTTGLEVVRRSGGVAERRGLWPVALVPVLEGGVDALRPEAEPHGAGQTLDGGSGALPIPRRSPPQWRGTPPVLPRARSRPAALRSDRARSRRSRAGRRARRRLRLRLPSPARPDRARRSCRPPRLSNRRAGARRPGGRAGACHRHSRHC